MIALLLWFFPFQVNLTWISVHFLYSYVYILYSYVYIYIYHKHELEIARFGAHAPRAGAVEVKRLIYGFDLTMKMERAKQRANFLIGIEDYLVDVFNDLLPAPILQKIATYVE